MSKQPKNGIVPPGNIVFCVFQTGNSTHDRMWYVTDGTTTRAVFDWVQVQRQEVEDSQKGAPAIVTSFSIYNG